MNRIVKNNITLFVVIVFAVIAALALAVLAVIEHTQMSQYITDIDSFRAQIKKLIDEPIAPVDDNIPRLKSDIELYNKAASDLSEQFGNPAEPALAAFFKTLRTADGKEIDRAKFTEEFLKEWQLRKTTDQRNFFIEQFTKRFANWDEAIGAFKAELVKISQEPLERESMARDALFAQLGAPRDMDGKVEQLADYTEEYTESLRKMLSDKGVVIDPPSVGYFSFSGTGLPTDVKDFPLVSTQLDIIGELVRRIGASGVKTLSDFRIGSLGGTVDGGFRKYRYAFEVVGTMTSIRNLVRLIDSASTPRRVFVVKTISLYAVSDEVQELFEGDTGSRDAKEEADTHRAPAVDKEVAKKLEEERVAREKREAQRAEMLKKLPFYQWPNYGDVTIGASDECKAVICVDYITLAGGR